VEVDDYLEGAPEPQRSTLGVLRSTLQDLLLDAHEAVSYGMSAFIMGDKPVAGYAWAKRHCSYYPHSGAVLTELADLLDGYEGARARCGSRLTTPCPASWSLVWSR
jgi:uncharacterized protein YdhG (YjbR/CyaY superfamily)